jgi:hypothetical protein
MNHRQPDDLTIAPAGWAAVILGLAAVVTGIWAVTSTWPVPAVAAVVMICAPLAGLGAWVLITRISAGPRIRLSYQTWPRPALIITDTPRPSCPYCAGEGGWEEPYGGEDGEYAGEHDIRCDCWTSWHRTLLRLPRRLAAIADRRASRQGFSDEPPF